MSTVDNKLELEVLHLPLYAAALHRGLNLTIWEWPEKEPELAELWEELGLIVLDSPRILKLTSAGLELV